MFDVTSWADLVAQGQYQNYGIKLRDSNESDINVWSKWHSFDATNPANWPYLELTYNRCGNRPYFDMNAVDYPLWCDNVNCAGYALKSSNWDYYGGDWIDFGIAEDDINNCSTREEIYLYTMNKVNNWLDANINHTHISSYDSNISNNQYRVVIRVGYRDLNNNGKIDVNYLLPGPYDAYDFHFWYQTNTGQWAEKRSNLPSYYMTDTSSDMDPYTYNWSYACYLYGQFTILDYFYNSGCSYYAIDN